MSRPMLVVVGAGPGLGAAVARHYLREGYDVALLARSAERLRALATELVAEGGQATPYPVDLADESATAEVVTGIGKRAGRIDVVHFNPSVTTMKSPLELSPHALLRDLRVGVAALLTVVQAARPFMSAGGRVTATGSVSADRPWKEAASVGVQKAALRNLVAAVDAELRDHDIRAVSVTVNGVIAPGGTFDPAVIAGALYAAAHQPADTWQTELAFPTAPASRSGN